MLHDGKVAKLVDPCLRCEYKAEEATTVAVLALRCVKDSLALRPSMVEVVREF
jgi:hypothetical protein